MESREDRFYQYILKYRYWFSEWNLHPIFGNFFKNYENIICTYTVNEFIDHVNASSYWRTKSEPDGKNYLEIDYSDYNIPGAVEKGSSQLIPFRDNCNPNFVSDENLRICLVASLDESSYMREELKLEDYEFHFEVCSLDDILKSYRIPFNGKFGLNADSILYRKNHDFKNPFYLPQNGRPVSKEKSYDCKRAPLENFNWNQATGIGVFSGHNIKYHMTCIDIDGCDSENFVNYFLDNLKLPTDYDWVVRTGSGNGYHIWIWSDGEPNILLKGESRKLFESSGIMYFRPHQRFQNSFNVLEIRWNAFCVLPPSLGMHGSEYTFRYRLPRTGMFQVDSKLLFDEIDKIAENTTIDHRGIIYHNGFWSDDEEVDTIFMCFDTETTGLPRDYNLPYTATNNWPHIVQISYVLFNVVDGEINHLAEGDFILSPDDSYSIPSNMIHGISNEKATTIGYRRHDVFRFLARQLDYVDYLIGHNLDFDINVLRAEFEREHIDVSKQFDYIERICTMKSAKPLYPSGSPWPKLEKLYKDLTGKVISNAHNAVADVNATIECFKSLYKRNLVEFNTKKRLGDTFTYRTNN